MSSPCRAADSVLLDRRLFLLDDKGAKRFVAALDKAPADNPKLRRLLTSNLLRRRQFGANRGAEANATG